MTKKSLGEVARFINGFAFKPSDWGQEGLPIIRIQNLTGTNDDFNFTTRKVKSELIVEPGNLLVSWSATLDVYRWNGPRGLLNQHIFKVFPYSGIDAAYLFFALKDVVGELSHKTHGSTMKHVVRGDFESTKVRVPPVAEQRRIVDILSRAEGIIRLQRQAAAKAREIIPALFLDMFGDPAMNPKGWPLIDIGNISTFVGSGITPRGGADIYVSDGPYFIRSQNVLMNRLDLTGAARLPPKIHEEMGRTRVHVGDVLLNITGASIGRVCTVDALPGEANVNQHVCIIRVDAARAMGAFASVLLSLPYHQQLINQVQAGASRQALNYQQVRAIRIPIPPLRLQQAFAKRVSEIHGILAQRELSQRTGSTLFQALLAQAFSG